MSHEYDVVTTDNKGVPCMYYPYYSDYSLPQGVMDDYSYNYYPPQDERLLDFLFPGMIPGGPPPGQGVGPGGPGVPPPFFPPGGGGQTGGPQSGPPTSPPPPFTPTQSQQQVGVFAVDPGSIRGCLFRFTYVWLENRQQFWFYPVFVGRRSVAGYRWNGFRWLYFGIDLRQIQSFTCV